MSIMDEMLEKAAFPLTLHKTTPGTRPYDDRLSPDVWGRKSPETGADLERVLAIPRRHVSEADKEAMVELMGRRLRLPDGPCACASYGRKCITMLKTTQAWALYEAGIASGLLGQIVVGGGKTGLGILTPMVVRDCKTAALLVPPKLIEQLKAEYMLWAQHWRVPSLLCRGGWAVINKGAPVIHAVSLSQLSRPNAATLLKTLAPDTIIIDETHKFKRRESTRTDRLMRYIEENPGTRVFVWSGTLTDKSIKDYAHLSGVTLGANSPLPLDKDQVAVWSAAIDPPKPGNPPGPIGALKALCDPGEPLRRGYRRRLRSTRGVVITEDAGIGASLPFYEQNPGPMPEVVASALDDLRVTWQRPDGKELVEQFELSKCARELALGFYYRWIFPRGEPVELIKEWFEARRLWSSEVRKKLKGQNEDHLDSPFLLANAAHRYYWRHPETGEPYKGDAPTWASEHWQRWVAVRDKVKPETEAVWLDDYLARDAAEWARKHRGIVWYDHVALGVRIAELSGLPMHGGGPDAEPRIKAERGDRSIIASIRSHGEGRDGLQFLFHDQLVADPPVSKQTGGAGRWEQLLGRLHREGQEADEVNTWVYRHTIEMRDAFDRAQELARYVTETTSSFQKLLACTPTWKTLAPSR